MTVRVAVHRSWFVAFGVGVFFVALAFLHPLRAHAATITVTGNGDTIAIDGLATLREAITSINNQADVNGDVTLNRVGNYATMVGGTPDVINFNILGGGVKTISVTSALPTLITPMTINGYSEPLAMANSSQNGDNANILIELDGRSAGGTANGLVVGAGAGGTVIEGLAINRFSSVGILVSGVSATITGNFIGTDAIGNAALPNLNGVLLQVGATNSTVGGATAPARNLISGNSGSGVGIQGNGTTGNVIEGNYIGTNATGATALGNSAGVNILGGASGNTIGGSGTGAGNVISGNTNGVAIQDSGTTNKVVEGNDIGTDATGTAALPNSIGVFILSGADGNTVGGTAAGAGNIIAFNTLFGVSVGGNASDASTINNAVLGNSIHDNGGATGLDLGQDGVTANGINPRPFPNDGQNYPVLTAAYGSAVTGTLDSVASAIFRVEFFSSPSGAPGGRNGQTFLGFVTATTNGSGHANFTFTAPSAPPAGSVITATATNTTTGAQMNDTSEFSAPLTLPSGITATAGTPQSALVNQTFGTALATKVTDSTGAGLANIPVTFTAPASGASGTFTTTGTSCTVTGGSTIATCLTNASGIATAPTYTANGTAGPDTVVASVPGLTPTASFLLQNLALLTISPTTLPALTMNTPLSQQLTATGGTGAPYTFAVTGGALPAGLTLDTSGLIHGTPTTPGPYSVTITATDAGGNTGVQTYTGVVGSAITISPTTLPSGAGGVAYSQTLTANGGSGTGYLFTVTSGTLPPGLTLSTSGTLNGTPTSAGMSTFTVQVRDSLGNTATQPYTLTITAAPLTSIALTGPGGATALTLKVGQSAVLTATGTYADGSTQIIPPGQLQWQSSNSAVVKVDASGNVTAESAGSPVTITATLNGVPGRIIVTVTAPIPVGITVPPVPPSRPSGPTSGPSPLTPPAPLPPPR